MATIRTQLYRDGQKHPWVTVEVLNHNEMEIVFANSKGEIITIGNISKKDAEQLGDIIRNASIDYMEDSEA
jgi:hypothetical protein